MKHDEIKKISKDLETKKNEINNLNCALGRLKADDDRLEVGSITLKQYMTPEAFDELKAVTLQKLSNSITNKEIEIRNVEDSIEWRK